MASKPLLDQTHCDTCTQVLRHAADTAEYLDKAIKAGIPVDHLVAQNQATIDLAQAIKQHYFPHQT